MPARTHVGNDHAETDRSSAATLDAYPADPDNLPAESYADRDLERAAVAASSSAFSSMVEPSLMAASECGNMYAGEWLLRSHSTACTVQLYPSGKRWKDSDAIRSLQDEQVYGHVAGCKWAMLADERLLGFFHC